MSHASHCSPAGETDDGWTIEQLRGGDQEAWREAYKGLWRIAYAAIRGRIFAIHTAEDLAQETLSTVAAEINNLADSRHIKVMTAIVARRKAAHYLRDQTAGKRDRRLEVGLEGACDVEQPAVLGQWILDLEQALEGLEPLDRTLLQGHFVRGLKSHELAAEHGLNASTVRGRMKRARDNLKEKYAAGWTGGWRVLVALFGLHLAGTVVLTGGTENRL